MTTPNSESKTQGKKRSLPERIITLSTETIWNYSVLGERTLRGRFYALLRIFTIMGQGIKKNKILSHAAALSYYSLISMGPVIALAVMISGFVFQHSDNKENAATEMLNRIITFIAPPVEELSKMEAEQDSTTGQEQGVPNTESLNPELVNFLNHLVDSARSGTVGLVGSLMLVFIVIQSFSLIEKAFNVIWGVEQGRRFIERVILYWSMLSLGAVFGFSALTLVSASSIISFFDKIPFGSYLIGLVDWIAPVLSFLMIAFLLGIFYRFIPNTSVRWKPAFIGALIVTAILFINNYLSFLYVSKVIRAQSLYGSIGIMPILMFGLYVFWLFILVGGQMTYSIQNANFLTIQRVWDKVSFRAVEFVSLTALILICRRFKNCKKPYNIETLKEIIRVPLHVLNQCLERLEKLNWISSVETEDEEGDSMISYQPARPLESMTLAQFKKSFECFGSNTPAELVVHLDPIIRHYKSSLAHEQSSENEKNFNQLIKEMPAT